MKTSENTGLFITRAQPGLHAGHLDAICQGVSEGITDILIGVGSANKEMTPDNPFTYKEREKMIEESIKLLPPGITVKVFPIPDTGDDDSWKRYILKNIDFDTIISGNPWVQNIFFNEGKKIISPKITKIVKAENIRRFLSENNYEAIKDMINPDVIHYLKSIEAHVRLKQLIPNSGTSIATMSAQEISDYIIKNDMTKEMKKLLQGGEPITPKIAVDIITLYQGKIVLIKRKNEPFGYALPGGFVDVGETIEHAAIREVDEEAQLQVKIVKQLSNYDSPLRDPRGHTISVPFVCDIISGIPTAKSDAESILLVEPTREEIEKIEFAFPDHKEMIYIGLGI